MSAKMILNLPPPPPLPIIIYNHPFLNQFYKTLVQRLLGYVC